MALPVDVSSIDVLRSVREALLLFADDAKGALGAMESEIRHAINWLTQDQRLYWQGEVKRRSDDLSSAKAELGRKRLGVRPGDQPHDSEQREAVRDAKQKLEEAEVKVDSIKRWLPVLERAVMEYDGQARPFADMLEFETETSIAMLDRMIDALDEYLRISVPETNPATMSTVPSAAPTVSNSTAVVSETKTGPAAEDESNEAKMEAS